MAGTPWDRVALGALAVLAVVAALTVVTDDPPRDADRPGPASELLGAEPDWIRVGGLAAAPGSSGVRNGLVLLRQDGGLTLTDLRTGEPRWTVRAAARLAGSTEVFSGGGILVGAGVLVRTRTGIAMLSPDDGTVRWRSVVRAPPGERYALVAADDETALVTVGPTRGGPPSVVAVDVGGGERRWARAGMWPHGIAGDVVVGETALAGGTVAAWDLATGVPAWTLTGFVTARVALTADDDVLVEGRTGPSRWARRVLEAATGEPLADLGDPRAGPCATDWRTLIACPLVRGGRDHAVETFGVADRRVRILSGDYRPEYVCLVGAGHVFGASPRSYFAVAAGSRGAGRLVARDLPGRPVAVTERYLVLRHDSGDPPSTSVYRLRK
ncbi:PQQ-binding-like beta-propeller repeat protein [Actinophytocola sp.]|uniref:outer membrane protein assembly factor BamB family protein n=1 Tax=Actinophytocola sp. TaxID=1872138 RepID=UPI003D6A96A4